MVIHRRPIQINVKSLHRKTFVFIKYIFSEADLLLNYRCPSLGLLSC